jgi:hypothetical protein
VLEGLRGVLERLSRHFVRRGMILFVMMRRRGSVRMGGKFVEIGGFLVRIARHESTSLLTLAHRRRATQGFFGGIECYPSAERMKFTVLGAVTGLTGKHRIDVGHARSGFRLEPPRR